MKTFFKSTQLLTSLVLLSTSLLLSIHANATSLSLGADYKLKGVSITERLKNKQDNDYYDSRLQAYLTTDLSKDVEATIRVQSINPWGLEGSTTSLGSRYPNDNGNLFVQNAFVRLPNLWKGRMVVTLGRQPIVWGDGTILSDDELGFNAIRAQIKSPFRWLPIDLDAFSAKISESLQADQDTDLHGAKLGFDRKSVRWDIMALSEQDKADQQYILGASTLPITATEIDRLITGIRGKANLRDAFLKGEFYLQDGEITQSGSAVPIDLAGQAWLIGLGGKADTGKIVGRFGAILEISEGEGDDPASATEEEAFRPTFASRWDGLERKGYGGYFASTFSDVYSSTSPFAPASSVNDGLPEGTSGIRTIHFGVESTPLAKWTFTFDYYQYKATNNLVGSKELGTEFDYGLIYRYSGLVTFRATLAQFKPGEAFNETLKQDASRSTIEAEIRF